MAELLTQAVTYRTATERRHYCIEQYRIHFTEIIIIIINNNNNNDDNNNNNTKSKSNDSNKK